MAGIDPVLPAEGSPRITEDNNFRITETNPVDQRITDTGYTSYKIWRHEIGSDEIDGSSINAIYSYFETGDISMMTSEKPTSAAIRISMVEPDFVQSGDMTLQITGRINARAPEVNSEIKFFPAVANTPEEQQVFFKEQRRELRFKFGSNTVGGDYQMGEVIAHIESTDHRYQS
jgi:hypothetical protein